MTSLTAEPVARGAPTRTRVAALGGVALLFFLLVLGLVECGWAPLLAVDDRAGDALHRVAAASPAFVRGMRGVSSLGTISVYLGLLALLVVHLLRQGGRRAAGFAVWTVVAGSLLNTSVKQLVGRARPLFDDPVAQAAHSSFPSGHAQAVVVAGGVLLVTVRPALPVGRRLAAVVAWALLMGFSRVALGVHYVSDVLGGYLLALAWLAACLVVFAPRRPAPPLSGS